jgi:hypothetical protein
MEWGLYRNDTSARRGRGGIPYSAFNSLRGLQQGIQFTLAALKCIEFLLRTSVRHSIHFPAVKTADFVIWGWNRAFITTFFGLLQCIKGLYVALPVISEKFCTSLTQLLKL